MAPKPFSYTLSIALLLLMAPVTLAAEKVPLASAEGDRDGSRIEITELRRGDDGVVTLKLRIYNDHAEGLMGAYEFADPRHKVADSLEEFERAVELDPGFARAHAAIADVHNILGAYDYAVEPPAQAYAAARRAADSAIALAPELGAGHAALAVTLFNYDWNWKRAEQEFLKA
ncbi:MAG: hypothetical protein KY432_03195, partial [Acidobacteria bacterium]|nr:hypothetical protein [Acidobacteriota bacterium]